MPGGQHHDFVELPDGNLLIASDAEDFSTVEDRVVEIDRESGKVVWELDMKDLISQEDGQSASMDSDGSEETDWFHNNGLWYDAEHDLVLLSARHKDAIVAVNKEDKTLAWIFLVILVRFGNQFSSNQKCRDVHKDQNYINQVRYIPQVIQLKSG